MRRRKYPAVQKSLSRRLHLLEKRDYTSHLTQLSLEMRALRDSKEDEIKVLNKISDVLEDKSGRENFVYCEVGDSESGFFIKRKNITYISTISTYTETPDSQTEYCFYIVVDGCEVDFKFKTKEEAKNVLFEILNINKIPEFTGRPEYKETKIFENKEDLEEKLNRVFSKGSKESSDSVSETKNIDLEALEKEVKNKKE